MNRNTHTRPQAMAALGLRSIAELVCFAVGSGLLEADSSQAAVWAARPSAA